MFLDKKKQPLFGLEVVVESRQRHAAGARKVAHGSAFVAFLAEDIGGVDQYFSQSLVISRLGWHAGRGCDAISCGNGCCGGEASHSQTYANSNVRSNNSVPSRRLVPQANLYLDLGLLGAIGT